jgi:hypothetical protein
MSILRVFDNENAAVVEATIQNPLPATIVNQSVRLIDNLVQRANPDQRNHAYIMKSMSIEMVDGRQPTFETMQNIFEEIKKKYD